MLALEHFQKNSEQYWLVVADIRMPLMDGYQFIKKVKEIKPNVKVFFLSAFLIDDIQFRTGLALVKADEYIEKPIPLIDFVRLLKKYFLILGNQ
jgi:two-component system response regulator YesN